MMVNSIAAWLNRLIEEAAALELHDLDALAPVLLRNLACCRCNHGIPQCPRRVGAFVGASEAREPRLAPRRLRRRRYLTFDVSCDIQPSC